jgi:hypothetical protein
LLKLLFVYLIHIVSTGRDPGEGLEVSGSYGGSLEPGSFYYIIGLVDDIPVCTMNLTATVVADDAPTTNTPNPAN